MRVSPGNGCRLSNSYLAQRPVASGETFLDGAAGALDPQGKGSRSVQRVGAHLLTKLKFTMIRQSEREVRGRRARVSCFAPTATRRSIPNKE